ncbi:glycoside hydrolase family 16 protein [Saccharothrix coeruleofusca]|uniref:Endo-1,3-beta-glucanase n=1 Tax=Saccharothrix coeruleofusca TaxID=33919 RepID=A0A918EFS4_9PSEU|nr:glycoside hydrolase family 16 protein [Saccharothrix coeruleofusca]MBP2337922.1 beta-glucanase (GH16 family) [Saccharothrix coeruleofusca]GGP63118.1 endo-1,3-beta-glucanase [Saccharothrix coeruleofusca]
MRTRVLVGAIVLTLGGLVAPMTAATGAPPAATPQAAAQEVGTTAVTWEENFDGPAGSRVNAARWNTEIGDNHGNNKEHQYYTDSASNAALDGAGNLVITARKENPGNYNCWYGRCQYTSARINTAGKFSTTYGRVEARMKMPRGKGIWPAFWMLGSDINNGVPWPSSGEIDIMEFLGHQQNTVYGTIHGPGYSGAEGIGMAYNGPNFADGFHTFAVDWTPNSIAWSVDGHVYQRRTPADLGGDRWVFDKPFFIILNLAVGGEWPGYPDASTVFPQQFVIDYVRVSSTSGGGAGGRITGLAGKCLDVANGNSANATPIQIHDCNGTAAQQWSRPGDGTIRAFGKCLDAANAGTADGTPVQLYECNGTGAQQWAVSAANDIVNIPADKCLDVKDNNPNNGARVQLWTCAGTANQKWTVS